MGPVVTQKLRSTQEWWAEVKCSPTRLHDWLQKQYHGEVTAATRVEQFRDQFIDRASPWHAVISLIATQERTHAKWVGELLSARGLEPKLLAKDERYWNQALAGATDASSLAATAAHAETMRLERIRVIAADPKTPADIRDVFARILPDEEFHARAFLECAGVSAFKSALERHERGMAAINLSMESIFPAET